MNQQAWVYLSQLTQALQTEGVDGARAGEFVAEIDSDLTETGADPVEEFGTPHQLAAELSARSGSRRPGWLPPMWTIWLLGLVAAMVSATAIDAVLLGWDERGIPIRARGVVWIGVLYLGIFGLKYVSTKHLDGRTWASLAAPRLILFALAIGVVTTTLSQLADEAVVAYAPPVQIWMVGILGVLLLLIGIWRRNDAIRFPNHAQHLNRLRWGWLAGGPPNTSTTR